MVTWIAWARTPPGKWLFKDISSKVLRVLSIVFLILILRDGETAKRKYDILAHGHKWGGFSTYCELRDSPVVVDPMANSGGADEKKVKKPRGPYKKKEK